MTIFILLRCDWLLIRDGSNKEAPPIGSKMCGSTVPQPIVGSGNELFIEFHSDGVETPNTIEGFQIQLKEGRYMV